VSLLVLPPFLSIGYGLHPSTIRNQSLSSDSSSFKKMCKSKVFSVLWLLRQQHLECSGLKCLKLDQLQQLHSNSITVQNDEKFRSPGVLLSFLNFMKHRVSTFYPNRCVPSPVSEDNNSPVPVFCACPCTARWVHFE
jgi:hypothetical protein